MLATEASYGLLTLIDILYSTSLSETFSPDHIEQSCFHLKEQWQQIDCSWMLGHSKLSLRIPLRGVLWPFGANFKGLNSTFTMDYFWCLQPLQF